MFKGIGKIPFSITVNYCSVNYIARIRSFVHFRNRRRLHAGYELGSQNTSKIM